MKQIYHPSKFLSWIAKPSTQLGILYILIAVCSAIFTFFQII